MAKGRLQPLAGDHRSLGHFLLASLLLWSLAGFAAPATMRVDYYHTGNHREETFSLDQIVIEPLPWPGDLAPGQDWAEFGARAGLAIHYNRDESSPQRPAPPRSKSPRCRD